MRCVLQDLSLARRHIISTFLALFHWNLSVETRSLQLEDGPALLTVWRPHDFISMAVGGGPHYVSPPGSMGSLFWLGSGAAQHGAACVRQPHRGYVGWEQSDCSGDLWKTWELAESTRDQEIRSEESVNEIQKVGC